MEKFQPINWLLTRRSIRKYSEIKISNEDIQLILNAAMHAPSARNCQPWHFIVIQEKELLKRISEIHTYASFVPGASHAILVCGDEKLQNDDGYYIVDCGAATQNILLAAHTMGIGSCWIGIHPRENRKQSFRELFGLPEYIQPYALVSLGYPSEEKQVSDRFKPERIHYNTWGKQ